MITTLPERILGRTERPVSVVGLGTWQLGAGWGDVSEQDALAVLDATTGQNGLVQATVFADVVDITGIVLTKLDGTAKGGIVVAVQRTLNVPVKLVGLGEGADDLAPFEPAAFVDALLGD